MKKIKDNKNNKHIKKISIKLLIISSILVFLLSIGATYAVLTWNSGNTTIAGSTLCFGIGYSKGQDIEFSVNNRNLMVASTNFDENKAAVTYVAFRRRNGCTLYGKGTIKVNVTSTADLSTGALKYKIINSSNTQVASGSITSTGISTIYSEFNIITAEKYTIYFWLDANYIDNSYLEATFSGTIDASARSIAEYGDIAETYTLTLGSNTIEVPVDTDAGVDFSKTSEQNGTNGIYVLSDTVTDDYPIFYYRGGGTDTTTGEELVKNNLIFADTCWKIIRTTSTGGLRLIYNGTPSSGTCNNTGTASQIGTKAFNSSYISPAYVGYMYGTVYNSASATGTGWYYAPDVSYSGGSYTLTAKDSYNVETKSDISGTNLNYQHYTCGSSSATTCTSVRYVYYVSSSTAYYITLTNGKKVEDALSEMLDYNTTSSIIKGNDTTTGTVDYWYKNNIDNNSTYKSLIDYSEIFCNDRSIYQLNGWNPDGGSTSAYLYFGAYGRLVSAKTPTLTCSRDIDKFTVVTASVGNKTLTYPVGLITADEIVMAGSKYNTSNSKYYLYTGQNWWAGSPFNFFYNSRYAFEFYVTSNGLLYGSSVVSTNGVRPVVSLASGYTISDGDGSTGSPYIVG